MRLHDALLAKAFGGSGSGGVSSWNDLTDKPFYEEIVEKELASGDYVGTIDTDFGVFFVGGSYYEQLDINPKQVTITLDGVTYKDLKTVYIQNLGYLCGNLYYLNSIAGTSFENTGEPFMAGVGTSGFKVFLLDTAPTQHSVKITTPSKVVHTISQDFIEAPTFNLIEMGLPDIAYTINGNEAVSLDSEDLEELYQALKRGSAHIILSLGGMQWHGVVCGASWHDNDMYFMLNVNDYGRVCFTITRGWVNMEPVLRLDAQYVKVTN